LEKKLRLVAGSLVARLPGGGEMTGNRLTVLLCARRLQQANNYHPSLSNIRRLTLVCDHLKESYRAVLSCGTVYYAVQGGSNF